MKRNCSVLFVLLFLFASFTYSGCAARYEDIKESRTPEPSVVQSNTVPSYKAEDIPEKTQEPQKNIPETSPEKSEAPKPSASAKATQAKQTEDNFAKLAPTTRMSFAELVGDNGDYSKPDDYPASDTYKIVVNIHYQLITAYKKDDDGKYTVPVRYMICSSGSREKPTPIGTYRMGSTRYRFSEFKKFKVFGQYWSQVTGSIYFHSLLYTKKNAKTYTKSSYRNLGRRVSHGCIRLLVPDARWIYYNAAPGTTVKIIKGKKDEKMAAIKKKLKRPKVPSKRPNLKKGKIPETEPRP
jgi:lipoprotein-anchoring transpeptidase ErfK/SrfK